MNCFSSRRMSLCLKRNWSFLKRLSKCGKKKRTELIQQATPDQIRSLTEIASNVIKGNFKVNEETVKKFNKHKEHIRHLAKKTISHKKKKDNLTQKGGFLPLLITPV